MCTVFSMYKNYIYITMIIFRKNNSIAMFVLFKVMKQENPALFMLLQIKGKN